MNQFLSIALTFWNSNRKKKVKKAIISKVALEETQQMINGRGLCTSYTLEWMRKSVILENVKQAGSPAHIHFWIYQ